MRRLVIFILTLSFAFLASANCTSQIKKDTATAYRNKVFSKQVWDSLRKSKIWIYDIEGILIETEERELNNMVNYEWYANMAPIEIVIVTIDTTQTTKDQFDDFVLNLHNSWEVGKTMNNNGIVIGVSAGLRKIRISNGYGITRVLSDTETKQVIDAYFLPQFRLGYYYAGLYSGIHTLMSIIRGRLK